MLTRRAFVARLAAAAAALTVDPERLLWVPGQKRIFIPDVVRVRRLNRFAEIDVITREALRVLENNLTLIRLINREYDERFGPHPGTVVSVPPPRRNRWAS